MKGLELSREFYSHCRPLLYDSIPDIMAKAAVGLAGEGSECFGCDDEFSRDHDYGPGFCLWLDDDLLHKERNRIEAAFWGLPKSFAGLPARLNDRGRVGPMGIKAFYAFFTGLDEAPANWRNWRLIPEEQLAAATNGEVFEDAAGVFTRWRRKLLDFYPRDIWLKKLAARVMTMAQAGQYNLPRSLQRGASAAAMLAAARFSESALSFVFLVNKRYMPFYKWSPKIARTLKTPGPELADLLDSIAGHPLRDQRDMGIAELVEDFCALCAAHLRNMGLSGEKDSWLWAHGPQIAAHIKNEDILRMNLLRD